MNGFAPRMELRDGVRRRGFVVSFVVLLFLFAEQGRSTYVALNRAAIIARTCQLRRLPKQFVYPIRGLEWSGHTPSNASPVPIGQASGGASSVRGGSSSVGSSAFKDGIPSGGVVALRTFSSIVFATCLARSDNSCHGSPSGSSDESAGAGVVFILDTVFQMTEREPVRVQLACRICVQPERLCP
jgi:hypothetical protein